MIKKIFLLPLADTCPARSLRLFLNAASSRSVSSGMREFNRKSHFWMKPLKAHLMCVDGIKVRGEISFISFLLLPVVVVGFCFWITAETNHQTISLFHYNFLPSFMIKKTARWISSFSSLLSLKFNCSRNSPFLVPRLPLTSPSMAAAALSGVCVFTCFFPRKKQVERSEIPAFYTHGILSLGRSHMQAAH